MRIYFFIPVFLLVCGMVVYSCGENNGGQAQTSSETNAPPNGAQIYKDNCVVCHGADGKAGISGASDLSKSTLPHAQVVGVITNGRNGMRSFKELTKAEIEAVAWYVETLRK